MSIDWDTICGGCKFRELGEPDINTGDVDWYCNRREYGAKCPMAKEIAEACKRQKEVQKCLT